MRPRVDSSRKNKIDKSLSKLTKRQRENNQINKIRNEKDDITIDPEEIQRTFRSDFTNLTQKKAREPSGQTSQPCAPQSWEMERKWTIF